MLMIAEIFPPSVAALLPGAATEPTLPANTLLSVDDATGDLDVIQVASALDVVEAAMGGVGAFVAPLATFDTARRTLLVAGLMTPSASGVSTQVETDQGMQERRVHWHAVTSALLTVQELGIGVVFCRDEAQAAAAMIQMLLRRDRRPVVVRRIIDPRSDAINWLAAIPGIGEETARALLDYAGCLAYALCALTGDEPPPRLPANGAWRRAVARAKSWLGVPSEMRIFLTMNDEERHESEPERD